MVKKNIAILTFTLDKAGFIPLSNLANGVCSISDEIYIIGVIESDERLILKNNKCTHINLIKYLGGGNRFTRVLKVIRMQLHISFQLIKIRNNIDIVILFMGGEVLILPNLVAKFFGKRVILQLAASSLAMNKCTQDNLYTEIEYINQIAYKLSDKIILYSSNLIKEWKLQKYKNKIIISHEHFLDFNEFKVNKKFEAKENIVGCIGRLSKEKGALNFIKAITKIVETEDHIKFFVGGDGQQRSEIDQYIKSRDLTNIVTLAGWIPHNELPKLLNNIRLIVLPSYTEGLPNLMLEAMACGTPVLATPVGAIPDIIKDRVTGFIMENNSPECIAKNVMRALEHPNLKTIAENARELVEQEFTYEATVDRWKKIMQDFEKTKL